MTKIVVVTHQQSGVEGERKAEVLVDLVRDSQVKRRSVGPQGRRSGWKARRGRMREMRRWMRRRRRSVNGRRR